MNKIKLYFLSVSLDGLPKGEVIESACLSTNPYLNWHDQAIYEKSDYESEPHPFLSGVKDIPPIQYVESIDTMNNESFYRTPLITLPQNKTSLLKSKYNISIKRDIDKANYLITSDNYYNSLFHSTYDDYIPFYEVKGLLDENKRHYEDYSIIEDFFSDIEDHNEDTSKVYIALTLRCGYDIKRKLSNSLRSITGYDNKLSKISPFILKNESMSDVIYNHAKVVSDQYIISRCNEDSVILKPEDLKNIATMLKSDDLESAALALEMMANCNIEKSFDKIALMFAFYLDYMKRLHNWNSVNVKSMRKIFKDISQVHYHYTYGFESLIKTLSKKNALTGFAQKVIMKKMYDTTLSRVGLTRENSIFNFKVSDLKLKDDINIPF